MEAYILIAIIAYCIGSISFSIIFSKKFAGFDVRDKGSKNAGSTNMLRTAGKGLAALTLICDILKGVVAILIARIGTKIWPQADGLLLQYIAGFSAILGHTYPIFFGFRGGKGVATSLGVLLILNWKIGLICLFFAIIIMSITKMVSVGSILAAILYPILILFLTENAPFSVIVVSLLIALLIIYNHRGNIKRIKEGDESKINFKK